MGFYERRIFPYVLDLAMRGMNPLRADALAAASGEVLEIGFGTGLNLAYYPPGVTRVHALDPADLLAERVAKRIAAAKFPVERHQLRADGRLPFDAASFDCVDDVTLCTIPARSGAEIRRVLRPGAPLLFLEHGRSDAPRTARVQDFLNPAWGLIAGGCNINRRPDALMAAAGLRLDRLDRFRADGPAVLATMYRGVATGVAHLLRLVRCVPIKRVLNNGTAQRDQRHDRQRRSTALPPTRPARRAGSRTSHAARPADRPRTGCSPRSRRSWSSATRTAAIGRHRWSRSGSALERDRWSRPRVRCWARGGQARDDLPVVRAPGSSTCSTSGGATARRAQSAEIPAHATRSAALPRVRSRRGRGPPHSRYERDIADPRRSRADRARAWRGGECATNGCPACRASPRRSGWASSCSARSRSRRRAHTSTRRARAFARAWSRRAQIERRLAGTQRARRRAGR
jgi:SAM-dependent methyltransferase